MAIVELYTNKKGSIIIYFFFSTFFALFTDDAS